MKKILIFAVVTAIILTALYINIFMGEELSSPSKKFSESGSPAGQTLEWPAKKWSSEDSEL